MRYDPEAVRPMRDELVRLGAEELGTPEEVDQVLGAGDGTTLLVINSICGCCCRQREAGRSDGHGTRRSAGPDRDRIRGAGRGRNGTSPGYMAGFRPSSPSLALFQGGKHVFMLERHQIEGRDAGDIAEDLKGAYDRFCQSS